MSESRNATSYLTNWFIVLYNYARVGVYILKDDERFYLQNDLFAIDTLVLQKQKELKQVHLLVLHVCALEYCVCVHLNLLVLNIVCT